MLTSFVYIFKSEIHLIWRHSQEWLYPLCFFSLVIILFPLAFIPDPILLQKMIPGGIWLAALLASLLAVETIFLRELEDGHLEQLLLSHLPLTLILSAKLCAQWILTELPLILITPLVGYSFHLNNQAIVLLCVSLLLGTPILTLLGCLAMALTLNLKQQGVFLGLLILPLITPVLIFGVNIVQQSSAGLSIAGPLALLAALCLLAMTFLPWVISLTLRVTIADV